MRTLNVVTFQARAVIEGQFLARRAYGEDIGLSLSGGGRVIATGGASSNKAVLQVLADVFNRPVYVQVIISVISLIFA